LRRNDVFPLKTAANRLRRRGSSVLGKKVEKKVLKENRFQGRGGGSAPLSASFTAA